MRGRNNLCRKYPMDIECSFHVGATKLPSESLQDTRIFFARTNKYGAFSVFPCCIFTAFNGFQWDFY